MAIPIDFSATIERLFDSDLEGAMASADEVKEKDSSWA